MTMNCKFVYTGNRQSRWRVGSIDLSKNHKKSFVNGIKVLLFVV